jgi:hypothetical protein
MKKKQFIDAKYPRITSELLDVPNLAIQKGQERTIFARSSAENSSVKSISRIKQQKGPNGTAVREQQEESKQRRRVIFDDFFDRFVSSVFP